MFCCRTGHPGKSARSEYAILSGKPPGLHLQNSVASSTHRSITARAPTNSRPMSKTWLCTICSGSLHATRPASNTSLPTTPYRGGWALTNIALRSCPCPTSRYHYSSYGWVLWSAGMEKAANKSFFQIMADSWKGLGMAHAALDYPDGATQHLGIYWEYSKQDGRTEAAKDEGQPPFPGKK